MGTTTDTHVVAGPAPRVAAFYRFVPVDDPDVLRDRLKALTGSLGLRGTVLIAREGINGTVCSMPDALDELQKAFAADPRFAAMRIRLSDAAPGNRVFLRMKVLVKPEIVSTGLALEPRRLTGQRVDAQRWNELLDDPDVTVIDTRNGYETAIGTFPGALDPATASFREFPEFVDRELAQLDRTRPVAMFCTGGIRCEKASALLLERGFETVYQLDGGILDYLETTPPETNRWQGECFVFDQRVSLTANLKQGSYGQCHACRHPISDADRQSPDFAPGISCPRCIDRLAADERAGFAERARQVALAAERGITHLGPQATAIAGRDPDVAM